MLKISINCFTIYHLYYKDKFRIIEFRYDSYLLYSNNPIKNLTWTFDCAVNSLYFGYNLNNLANFSTVFLFAYDYKACINKLGLVIKKRKLPRTFLYFF